MNRDHTGLIKGEYNRGWFVHVPRTGGTSLVRGLGITDDHRPAISKRRHARALWNNAWTFGFVRNPWERVLSWFVFHRDRRDQKGSWRHYQIEFREWAKAGCPVHDGWHKWLREDVPDPTRAADFFCDQDGKIIVDAILQWEHYRREMAVIQARLGITCSGWPRAVVSNHPGPYQDYYDAASRDVVAERGRWECELIGYDFEEGMDVTSSALV